MDQFEFGVDDNCTGGSSSYAKVGYGKKFVSMQEMASDRLMMHETFEARESHNTEEPLNEKAQKIYNLLV